MFSLAEFGRGVLTDFFANPSRIWYEDWIPIDFSLACLNEFRHGEWALVPPVSGFVQCALVGEEIS